MIARRRIVVLNILCKLNPYEILAIVGMCTGAEWGDTGKGISADLLR